MKTRFDDHSSDNLNILRVARRAQSKALAAKWLFAQRQLFCAKKFRDKTFICAAKKSKISNCNFHPEFETFTFLKTQMKNGNQRHLITLFLVFTLLSQFIGSARAQDSNDIVGGASGDITSGSSVFVFKGRKKAQERSAFRSVQVVRTPQARIQARRERIDQSKTIAVVRPKPSPNPAPSPSIAQLPKIEGAARLVVGANEYLKQNNLAEAENGFFEASNLDPNNADAKTGLAAVYAARGDVSYEAQDYDRAILFYQKALAFDSANADVYASLGDAYDSLKQPDKAVQAYETALKLNNKLTALIAPLGVLYAATGNYAKSADYLKQALAAAPNDIKLRDTYGLVLYKLNRNDEARTALLKAIELNASNADSYYYLGGVYDRLGDGDKAIAAYQKAIASNPKYKEAFFDLAAAYYNRGQYKEAAENYDQAVRQQSNYIEARLNLADAYRQLADEGDKTGYGKAVNQYTVAVSLLENSAANAAPANNPLNAAATDAFKPNLADIYYKFSYCLGNNKQWTEAVGYMKKAVALQPDVINYTNLAWAYNGNKDYPSALTAAQEAVRLDQSLPAAYLNLGKAQANLNQFADAEKSFLQALKLRKDWTFALNNLGYVYGRMNNWKQAADAHRRVAEIEPNNVAAHYNLGFAATELGDKATAERERDILATLNPYRAKDLDIKIKNTVFGKDKKKNKGD